MTVFINRIPIVSFTGRNSLQVIDSKKRIRENDQWHLKPQISRRKYNVRGLTHYLQIMYKSKMKYTRCDNLIPGMAALYR
jgi:hypothetical protein